MNARKFNPLMSMKDFPEVDRKQGVKRGCSYNKSINEDYSCL